MLIFVPHLSNRKLIPTTHPPLCRKMSKACMGPVSRLEVSAVERSERGACGFQEGPRHANPKLGMLEVECGPAAAAFPWGNPHQLQLRPCPFLPG